MSFDLHPINALNAAGAPEFVTSDPKALLDLAKAKFEAETGRTLSPSQVEMYLLETVAYMLALRGAENQLAHENSFVAYARPAWLDKHGVDRNTPRLEVTPALTSLQFSSESTAVAKINIPAGTRVSDASNQAQFLTLDHAVIASGETSVEVKASAVSPGIAANGYSPGALSSLIDPVPGIASVSNLTTSSGGAERESDDRYRARLPLAFERIGDGLSRERYVSDVFGWSARCIDVDVKRPAPGYVNISPLMDTGAPTAEELASLLSQFNESNIHLGDFIQVFAPAAHDFSFSLVLSLSEPSAEAPALAALQSVLNAWRLQLGGFIAPSELTSAAKAVFGVIDADIPGLELTRVADNAWRNGTLAELTVELV